MILFTSFYIQYVDNSDISLRIFRQPMELGELLWGNTDWRFDQCFSVLFPGKHYGEKLCWNKQSNS